MKLNIGLAEKSRSGVVEILNRLLADEFVLYAKTRNYHWNVAAPNFSELHKFFESQYAELEGIVDEVAERARALGGRALGTLKEYLEVTRLKENPGSNPAAKRMIAFLLTDHERIIQALRNDLATCQETYQDAGTSDFLTGLMEQHEKMAWMLRSF